MSEEAATAREEDRRPVGDEGPADWREAAEENVRLRGENARLREENQALRFTAAQVLGFREELTDLQGRMNDVEGGGPGGDLEERLSTVEGQADKLLQIVTGENRLGVTMYGLSFTVQDIIDFLRENFDDFEYGFRDRDGDEAPPAGISRML